MTMFNIRDYGATPTDLMLKYDSKGQHPNYPLSPWRFAVREGATMLGYWEWVELQLQEEREELEQDNPYTQWEREVVAT